MSNDSIVVKVQRGDELRRFTIARNAPYEALMAKLEDLLNVPVSSISVMYCDDDCDWVTFSSQCEMAEAIRVIDGQNTNVLRLRFSEATSAAADAAAAADKANNDTAVAAATAAISAAVAAATETRTVSSPVSPTLRSTPAFVAACPHDTVVTPPFPMKQELEGSLSPAAKPSCEDGAQRAFAGCTVSPSVSLSPSMATYSVFQNRAIDSVSALTGLAAPRAGSRPVLSAPAPKQASPKRERNLCVPYVDPSQLPALPKPRERNMCVPYVDPSQLPCLPTINKTAPAEAIPAALSTPANVRRAAPAAGKAKAAAVASTSAAPAAGKPRAKPVTLTKMAVAKGIVTPAEVAARRKSQPDAIDCIIREVDRVAKDLEKEVSKLASVFEGLFRPAGSGTRAIKDMREGLRLAANEVFETTLGVPAFGPARKPPSNKDLIPQMVNSFESAVGTCTQLACKASSEISVVAETTAMELLPVFSAFRDHLDRLCVSFQECDAPEKMLVAFTNMLAVPDRLLTIVTEFVNKYVKPYLEMVLSQVSFAGRVAFSVNYEALIATIVTFISGMRSDQVLPLLEAFFKEFCVLVFELHKNMMNLKRITADPAGPGAAAGQASQGALMPCSVNFTHLEKFLEVVCEVLSEDQMSAAIRGLHTSFCEVITLVQSEAQTGRFGTLMGRLLPNVDVSTLVDKVCDNPPAQLRQLNQWAPFLTTYFASLSATQPIAPKAAMKPALAAPAPAAPVVPAPAPVAAAFPVSCIQASPVLKKDFTIFPVEVCQQQQQQQPALKSLPAPRAAPVIAPAPAKVPLPVVCCAPQIPRSLAAVPDDASIEEVVKQICSSALASVVEQAAHLKKSRAAAVASAVPELMEPSNLSDSFSSDKKMGCHVVSDVTFADGVSVSTSTSFVKTWCLRNTGELAWPATLVLKFVGGDAMVHPVSVPVPPLSPREECNVSVEFTSPAVAGHYVSYWKLDSAECGSFGRRMWVDVTATKPPAATDCEGFVLVSDEDAVSSVGSAADTSMYPGQMNALAALGYDDEFANDQVLVRCGGNLDEAEVDLLKLREALETLQGLGIDDTDHEECIHLLLKHAFDVSKVLGVLLA